MYTREIIIIIAVIVGIIAGVHILNNFHEEETQKKYEAIMNNTSTENVNK